MKTEHLTEHDLQAYAENPALADAALRTHLDSCERCRLAVSQYRLAFEGLSQLPADQFDFDLEALVMPALPAPRPEFSRGALAQYTGLAALILAACAGVAFGLRGLVTGLPATGLFLALTAVLAIALFRGVLLLDNYRQKMNVIDLY